PMPWAVAVVYVPSLHDALPIWAELRRRQPAIVPPNRTHPRRQPAPTPSLTSMANYVTNTRISLKGHPAFNERWLQQRLVDDTTRSEEHTSELQSRENLVCRLLL